MGIYILKKLMKINEIKINKDLKIKILVAFIIIAFGIFAFGLIKKLNKPNSYKKIYDVRINNKDIEKIEKSLNIQEIDYEWANILVVGNEPKELVFHHAAAENLSPEEVHAIHVDRGWSGIGYHFYIRSDGSIYKGRDANKIGSHVYGHNKNTLGICLEGNFEEKGVSDKQLEAAINLGTYLSLKYDIVEILKHNDLGSTECPGKLFPFESVKNSIIDKIKNIK